MIIIEPSRIVAIIKGLNEVNAGGFVDAHFDEIFNADDILRGEHLIRLSCDLLQAVQREAQRQVSFETRVLAYLPMGESRSIVTWHNELVDRLGSVPEPPSIYVFKSPPHWGERWLDDLIEEYRCPLPSGDPATQAMFRCYKNHGDDCYQLGLYLFSS